MENAENNGALDAARVNGVDDGKATRARRPKTVVGPAQPGTLPKAWSELKNKHRLGIRVNFHKLDTEALKKYRKFYKMQDLPQDATKEQLVNAVGRHFMGQQIDETKAISMFLKAAKQNDK